ncbi:MAG: hypothetical protein HY611_08965 [Elusimicrobia bacterium]|nr:hypothetical protein [Elusimicrobiota bacterium]
MKSLKKLLAASLSLGLLLTTPGIMPYQAFAGGIMGRSKAKTARSGTIKGLKVNLGFQQKSGATGDHAGKLDMSAPRQIGFRAIGEEQSSAPVSKDQSPQSSKSKKAPIGFRPQAAEEGSTPESSKEAGMTETKRSVVSRLKELLPGFKDENSEIVAMAVGQVYGDSAASASPVSAVAGGAWKASNSGQDTPATPGQESVKGTISVPKPSAYKKVNWSLAFDWTVVTAASVASYYLAKFTAVGAGAVAYAAAATLAAKRYYADFHDFQYERSPKVGDPSSQDKSAAVTLATMGVARAVLAPLAFALEGILYVATPVVYNTYQVMADALDWAVKQVERFAAWVAEVFEAFGEWIVKTLDAAIELARQQLQALKELAIEIGRFIKNLAIDLAKAIQDIAQAAWDFAVEVANFVADMVADVAKFIRDMAVKFYEQVLVPLARSIGRIANGTAAGLATIIPAAAAATYFVFRTAWYRHLLPIHKFMERHSVIGPLGLLAAIIAPLFTPVGRIAWIVGLGVALAVPTAVGVYIGTVQGVAAAIKTGYEKGFTAGVSEAVSSVWNNAKEKFQKIYESYKNA